jgi:hypothetical protein
MNKTLTQTKLAELIALEIRVYYRKNNQILDTRMACERLYNEGMRANNSSEISNFAQWYKNANEEELEKVERKSIRINKEFYGG